MNLFKRDKASIFGFECSASGLCTWSNPGKPVGPLLLNIDDMTVVLPATATSYQIPMLQLKSKETVTLQRANTITIQNTFIATIPQTIGPPVDITPPVIYSVDSGMIL